MMADLACELLELRETPQPMPTSKPARALDSVPAPVAASCCLQCGRMPFAVHAQQSLNVYIEQVTGDMQQRRFALPPRLSADAADMLRQLLHPDPAARINISGAPPPGLRV